MGLRDSVAEDTYVRALQGKFGDVVLECVERSFIAGCGVLVVIRPGGWGVHLSRELPFGEIRIVEPGAVQPVNPEDQVPRPT